MYHPDQKVGSRAQVPLLAMQPVAKNCSALDLMNRFIKFLKLPKLVNKELSINLIY